MESVTLPTYSQYKYQVDTMVNSNQLTVTQGIILLKCFNARLNESVCHINYLMSCTGLGWKEINWTLNGLVQKGAIRKIEEKYYTV